MCKLRTLTVNPLLRFFFDSSHFSRCILPAPTTHRLHHNRVHDLHSAGGFKRSFAFSTGVSHALHQVRKQGCPSSLALSSPKGGSRQDIADIPRFATPPGDAHCALGSLILLLLHMLDATTALILRTPAVATAQASIAVVAQP